MLQVKAKRVLILLLAGVFAEMTTAQTIVRSFKSELEPTKLAILSQGNTAKKFIRTETFTTDDRKDIAAIIYGNEQVGYFRSTRYLTSEQGVSLEFVPPTYLFPVEFFVETRAAERKKIKTVKYDSPDIAGLSLLKTRVLTQSSAPSARAKFFLLSSTIPPVEAYAGKKVSKHKGIAYLYLLNRLGEVIWAYIPGYSFGGVSEISTFKLNADGKLGVIYGGIESFFETIDYRGQRQDFFYGKLNKTPRLHHDFSYDGRYLRVFADNDRFFTVKDWEGYSELRNDVLMDIDIKNQKRKIVWNALDHYTPFGLEVESENEWASNQDQHDFVHASSLDFLPGLGHLLSFRNIHTLAMYDEDLDEVVWTIGPNETDSFRTSKADGSQFRLQSAAKIASKNKVYVFDNGEKNSRLVAVELGDAARIKKVTEYRLPFEHHSDVGGDVEISGNGDIIGFFPSTKVREEFARTEVKFKSYIAEFNQENSDVKLLIEVELSSLAALPPSEAKMELIENISGDEILVNSLLGKAKVK